FDVIFCRNTLIYFAPEVVARVAARLFAALAEGGWLFTGASDPPVGGHAPFAATMTPAGIVYRRPGAREERAWAAPPPMAEDADAVVDDGAPGPAPLHPLVGRPEPEPGPEEALRAIRALADAGRIAEALDAAGAIARRFAGSAEVHYLRAVLLAEAG